MTSKQPPSSNAPAGPPRRWRGRVVLAALAPVCGFIAVVWWLPSEVRPLLVPVGGILAIAGLVGVSLADAGRREAEAELQRERQRLEAELELRHLREADRRRATELGVLAAGIAHELGQPLSAARVDIEGLHLLRQLGRELDPGQAQRVLSRVGTCILAMTQIVGHLRDLATAPGEVPLTTLRLDDIVRAVLGERHRWDVTGSVTIAWEPPTEACTAIGDAIGLRLVLVNLLRNACEAVSGSAVSGGQVRIVTGPGPRLAIHDTGPGIPAEQLAVIFDPFVSSKGGSRGVGLTLARASAERMGARLSVASDPGAGTSFTIEMQSA